MLEHMPQREEDAVGIQRLLDEVERAELRRLHRGLDGAVAGDHDHLCRRVGLPQLGQGLEAVHPRHLHIEHHEMRMELAIGLEGRLAAVHGMHVHALVLEDLAQGFPHAPFVVHHQHASRHYSIPR